MNIDEKIKELEEKLAKLKAKKEENKLKRWRAERAEKFYYIDVDGIVCCDKDIYCISDNFFYASGNYFQTKEEAEIYKQNRLTYQQLKDIALRLNNRQEIDWNNENQNKYFIFFNHEINKLRLGNEQLWHHIIQVYCLDENFLDVALEEIGEERLKQLLEWGI